MSKRLNIPLVLSLVAVAGSAHWGCSFTTINAAPEPGSSLDEMASARAAIKLRAKIADNGNFVISYEPATKKGLKVVAEAVKDAEAPSFCPTSMQISRSKRISLSSSASAAPRMPTTIRTSRRSRFATSSSSTWQKVSPRFSTGLRMPMQP